MILSAQGLAKAASATENDSLHSGSRFTARRFKPFSCHRAFTRSWSNTRQSILFGLSVNPESGRKATRVKRVFDFFEQLMPCLRIDPPGFDLDRVVEVATSLGNTELLNHFLQGDDSKVVSRKI
jgi:hypothetical protein